MGDKLNKMGLNKMGQYFKDFLEEPAPDKDLKDFITEAAAADGETIIWDDSEPDYDKLTDSRTMEEIMMSEPKPGESSGEYVSISDMNNPNPKRGDESNMSNDTVTVDGVLYEINRTDRVSRDYKGYNFNNLMAETNPQSLGFTMLNDAFTNLMPFKFSEHALNISNNKDVNRAGVIAFENIIEVYRDCGYSEIVLIAEYILTRCIVLGFENRIISIRDAADKSLYADKQYLFKSIRDNMSYLSDPNRVCANYFSGDGNETTETVSAGLKTYFNITLDFLTPIKGNEKTIGYLSEILILSGYRDAAKIVSDLIPSKDEPTPEKKEPEATMGGGFGISENEYSGDEPFGNDETELPSGDSDKVNIDSSSNTDSDDKGLYEQLPDEDRTVGEVIRIITEGKLTDDEIDNDPFTEDTGDGDLRFLPYAGDDKVQWRLMTKEQMDDVGVKMLTAYVYHHATANFIPVIVEDIQCKLMRSFEFKEAHERMQLLGSFMDTLILNQSTRNRGLYRVLSYIYDQIAYTGVNKYKSAYMEVDKTTRKKKKKKKGEVGKVVSVGESSILTESFIDTDETPHPESEKDEIVDDATLTESENKDIILPDNDDGGEDINSMFNTGADHSSLDVNEFFNSTSDGDDVRPGDFQVNAGKKIDISAPEEKVSDTPVDDTPIATEEVEVETTEEITEEKKVDELPHGDSDVSGSDIMAAVTGENFNTKKSVVIDNSNSINPKPRTRRTRRRSGMVRTSVTVRSVDDDVKVTVSNHGDSSYTSDPIVDISKQKDGSFSVDVRMKNIISVDVNDEEETEKPFVVSINFNRIDTHVDVEYDSCGCLRPDIQITSDEEYKSVTVDMIEHEVDEEFYDEDPVPLRDIQFDVMPK